MANAREIGRQLMADLKRDFGLTDAQAAGVVGNLMHESANFGSMQEINPIRGEGGYGYAQWTGTRRDSFEKYANSRGLDPNSYEANYGFLRHEINNDPYERGNFNKVRKATTASEAARIFSKEYLRPNAALAHNDRRIRNANAAYDLRSGPPGKPATRSTALAAIDRAVPKKTPSAFGYAPEYYATPQAPKSGKTAPVPATQSATLSKLRSGGASGTGLMKNFANAGDNIAFSPIQGGKVVSPTFDGIYDPRLGGMVKSGQPAVWGMGVTKSAPAMPKGSISYAAQDGGKSKSIPKLSTGVTQSYAGQEGYKISSKAAPVPAQKSAALTYLTTPSQKKYLPELPPSTLQQELDSTPRPRPRPNTTGVIATFPTAARPPSAFGAFPQGGKAPPKYSSNPINIAGIPLGVPSPKGTFVAQPAGSINNNKETARLGGVGKGINVVDTANVAPVPFNRPKFASIPNVGPQFASVPMPKPRPNVGVGTQIAVQPPKLAPKPFDRPNFGIGGPDLYGLPQLGAPIGAKTGVKSFSKGGGRPPLNILVEGSQTIQPPSPPPQMFGPSVIQQLRMAGLSAAAAYDLANASNSPRSAADNFGQGTSMSHNTHSAAKALTPEQLEELRKNPASHYSR